LLFFLFDSAIGSLSPDPEFNVPDAATGKSGRNEMHHL
jgi:hypothetical protein